MTLIEIAKINPDGNPMKRLFWDKSKYPKIAIGWPVYIENNDFYYIFTYEDIIADDWVLV